MDRKLLSTLPGEALVRLPEVLAMVGLKRSAVYGLIQQGRFPAPEKITARVSAWRVRDLFSWLECPLTWRRDQAPDGRS